MKPLFPYQIESRDFLAARTRALLADEPRVGKTPAALRSEWAMMAGGLLPLLTGGDPAGFRIAEAVSAFIREPRSFSVSMKGKAGPLRFMDFAAMSDPATFFSKVDLTVVANK